MLKEKLKYLEHTPNTTVDVVIVTEKDNQLYYLLSKRGDNKDDPFPNKLGLCGSFFDIKKDKNITCSAIRGLKQKVNLKNTPKLKTLETFSDKNRDPRWHTLTVVMLGFINYDDLVLNEELSSDVELITLDEVNAREIAFDHKEIINFADRVIKKEAQISARIVNLLPSEFTLPALQDLYEMVLNSKLDKSSFRKQVRESGLLVETGEQLKQARGKPALVYTVNPEFNIDEDWFFPRSVAKNK